MIVKILDNSSNATQEKTNNPIEDIANDLDIPINIIDE